MSPKTIQLGFLPENIDYFLSKEGISAEELANRCGLSTKTISNIRRKAIERTSVEKAEAIAAACHSDVNTLTLAPIDPILQQETEIKLNKVAYLLDDKSILDALNSNTDLTHLRTDQSLPLGHPNDGLFAYAMNDQSMFPRFEQGTLFILTTKQQPQAGNYTLIHLKEENILVFRIFEPKSSGEILLHPLNKRIFSTTELTPGNDTIVGTLVEARWFSNLEDNV